MTQPNSTEAPGNEQPNEEPHGTEEGTEETPSLESLAAQVETLKKESRKWEERAKSNKSAADELANLKRDSMTAEQQAQADLAEARQRAEAAESELSRLRIATEFGLSKEDAEALASVQDEEALRALAQRLAKPAGPNPNPGQGKRTTPGPASTAEQFAEVLEGLF